MMLKEMIFHILFKADKEVFSFSMEEEGVETSSSFKERKDGKEKGKRKDLLLIYGEGESTPHL